MLFPYVVDTNECLDNTCQNGVCINHEGSFQCKCFEGYHHDSNGICVDINECEEVHIKSKGPIYFLHLADALVKYLLVGNSLW